MKHKIKSVAKLSILSLRRSAKRLRQSRRSSEETDEIASALPRNDTKWQKLTASIVLIFIVALFYSASSLFSAFDDLGAGARALGFGNAFAGLSDDAFGFYYNPAGPGFIKQGQIGTDYGKLWMGLSDQSDLSNSFVAITLPLSTSKRIEIQQADTSVEKSTNTAPAVSEMDIAGSTESFKSPNVSTTTNNTAASPLPQIAKKEHKMVTNHLGTISFGWRNFSLPGFYQESSYYLGFSKSWQKLAAGVNIKMLSVQYNIDPYLEQSPVFEYGKKSSVQNYSADAGLLYNISPRLFIGLSASDINQPNMGLSSVDQLPVTGRLGLGWRQKDIKWAADAISRSSNWYGATGLEKWFNNMFALRGGFMLGGKNFANCAAGFSVNLSAARIDYAFQFPLTGVKDSGGSHRVGFIYRFGRHDEAEPGSLEFYYSKLQDEVAGLKNALLETEEEKKRLEEVLIDEATLRIREKIKAAKSEAREPRIAQSVAASVTESKEQKDVRHVVQKGETLQSIAEKYFREAKYWNEIYQINKDSVGRGGVLKPGQVLIIPSLSRSGIAVAESAPARTTQPAGSTAEIVPVKIAIPAAPVPAPEPVQIKIIPLSLSAEPPKPVKKDVPKPAAKKEALRHIVQPGENLQSIAMKYYNNAGRWKEIYEANKGKVTSGQLSPGQEITIP